MSHVRSFATDTPAAQSRVELEVVLARYGCSRSGSDMDREADVLLVWFTVPDSKVGDQGPMIPVRLQVNLRDIRERLKTLTAEKLKNNKVSREKLLSPEHVERVAWRHIVLLVEAGLVAAEAGVKRVSEFFLADTMVTIDASGRQIRMIEALDQDNRWRAMIGPGGSQ